AAAAQQLAAGGPAAARPPRRGAERAGPELQLHRRSAAARLIFPLRRGPESATLTIARRRPSPRPSAEAPRNLPTPPDTALTLHGSHVTMKGGSLRDAARFWRFRVSHSFARSDLAMLTRRPPPAHRRLLPSAGLCWLAVGIAALLSAGCQSED